MFNHSKADYSANNTVGHRTDLLFLPCNTCGSQPRKLGSDKLPGQSSLLCECGKSIKWISANEVALAGQLNNGGQQ